MIKDTILKVEGVYKEFDIRDEKVSILKNINFEVVEEDFFIVFGPSGCGKSTLLNTILGLEEPSCGSINLLGHDLYTLNSDERTEQRKKHIGVVYQQSNWIKSLNVLENVAFGSSIVGVERIRAQDKAKAMLQLVGMLDWAEYRPMDLSSGQQQKVALARALMNDPDLIIADEPTGNLDVQSGEELMQLFQRLNNTNKTIIMVTHNVENVVYAKKVLQMIDGFILDIKPVIPETVESLKLNLIEDLESKSKGLVDTGVCEIKNHHVPNKTSKFIMLLMGILYLIKLPLRILQFFVFLILLQLHDSLLFLLKLPKFSKKTFYKLSYRIIKFINVLVKFFDWGNQKSISRFDLMHLSIRNLSVRKTRTFLTVFGISIGIGIIVLLLSIGYGLENLIINKVATIDETMQIQASPAVASNIKIKDSVISEIANIKNIDKVYPVINVIGEVTNDLTKVDVAVYGVQSDYLKQTSNRTNVGDIYSDNSNAIDSQANLLTKLSEKDLTKTITLPKQDIREAIVNESMLKSINLTGTDPINKVFTIKFMTDNTDDNYLTVTENVKYTIVGVLSDDQPSPEVYVPISNLKYLSPNFYNSIKVIVNDKNNVEDVRKILETKGYITNSVADTVQQINSVFTILRIAFGIIGSVALAVALLGMVNTMTVSLLERTREVGLMKALGMKSEEVENLYLTESIIISVGGGILGIILGYGFGKVMNFGLSAYAISRGYSSVDIINLPIITVIIILSLSFIVGIIAGYYPARRAKNISVLDALRYE